MAAPDPRATLLTRQNDAADRELDEVSTASEPREVDLALRRYDIVFRYLATENQMSWTKNQFFLAANGGLLAFAPSRFPKDATWPSLLVPALIAITGLLFSLLWLSTLRRAAIHVDHWKEICRNLEPTAFGTHQALRSGPQTGMRKITRTIASVFIVVWGIAILALVIASFIHTIAHQ